MKTSVIDLWRKLNIPFVRHVAMFQVGSIVMTATGLLSSVVYARLLGIEQFGLFAVVSSFTGVLCIIASFGQETTLVTFLSEAVGRKSKTDIVVVLRYFIQSTLLALVVYAILFLLVPTLSSYFGESVQVGSLSRLLILNTALQSPPVLVFLMLQIVGNVTLVTVLENTRALLQVGIAICLLLLGYGIEGIIYGLLAVSILYLPICAYLYRKYARILDFPHLTELARTFRKGGTLPYFGQGLWIAFDRQVSRNLYPNLFMLVLSSTTSLATVGLFRLALRLGSLPADMISPNITRLAAVTIPRIAAQSIDRLKEACLKLMKGTLGIALGAVLGVAIIIPPLIPIVYGAEFSDAILPMLIILPFNLISAFSVSTVPIARLFKKVWLMTVSNAIGIVFGLIGFYLLRDLLGPLNAMAATILIYHVNSIVLALFLWKFILQQHKKISMDQKSAETAALESAEPTA
jgi:teichuronic acid exporter